MKLNNGEFYFLAAIPEAPAAPAARKKKNVKCKSML